MTTGNLSKEFCIKAAQEAHAQLFMSITKDDYLSWGVSHKGCCFYEGMATLTLKVSGLMHKGWVFVSLNEGKDLYEVRLLNEELEVLKKHEDVFCDSLGTLLDGIIERPASMSDEEYQKKAMADSMRKWQQEAI